MNNVEELRDSLLKDIDDIKTGALPVKEAEAITNRAGKVLATAMIQLKYSELRDEKPDIEFLESGKKQLAN